MFYALSFFSLVVYPGFGAQITPYIYDADQALNYPFVNV